MARAVWHMDMSTLRQKYFDPDGAGNPNPLVAPASVSRTKVGWTAGAGAEWMFAHDWSAKIEYLYLDLGSDSAIGSFAPPVSPQFQVGYTWHTRENIARVGVNYHFN